ncbi:cytochrome P450 [Bradyrhizobium sp.]|jgi:cytochrome P450|uniref:cytochrome P450 n=1 Tax=Bradyrhizobium sp. TaxID=376 RepID=UPI003C264D0B
MASNISEPLMQCGSQDRYSPFTRSAGHFIQSARLASRMLVYRASCYFLCHLWLFKFGFGLLRRFRPIFIFKKLVVVTRARDVREVLQRFDDFTMGDFIDPGMPWGTFLMTVDWRQRHAQERQLLQDAVDPTDVDKIRAIVDARCRRQIDPAGGRIDVVSQLLEPVVVDIAKEYFGVPPLAGSTQQMAHAMRDLAGIIMVNPPVGSEPWSRSRASIAKVTDLLLQELSHKSSAVAGPPPAALANDLLTRLVQRLQGAGAPNWFDEDWIRRYLTGLLATGGATIVRAGAGAIDQILAHPGGLEKAQAVAIELNQAAQSGVQQRVDELRETLRHFVHEALRFRPMLPLLIRDTPRETVIAYGTKRARMVRAGTRVLAPPLSAMFDPEAFSDPERFDPSRPFESYLHFGSGPRHCFGRYIAETVLLEVFRSLLVLPGLSRAAGPKGRLAFDGPVAAGLIVTFQS